MQKKQKAIKMPTEKNKRSGSNEMVKSWSGYCFGTWNGSI